MSVKFVHRLGENPFGFGTSIRFISRSMQNNAQRGLEPIMRTLHWRSTCPDADGIINSQTHYQPLGCDCCHVFCLGAFAYQFVAQMNLH